MPVTILLLGLALALALTDWWAVATDRAATERWAKPATMAVLVVVAGVAGDIGGGARIALVIGAVFGLVGDVALLDPGETAFLVGLSAFAAGHLAYVVAAVWTGFTWTAAIPGFVVMAVLLSVRFVGRTVPGARRAGGDALAAAVVVYAAVISAMVVTAWATGLVVAGVGATLFALSDWVLGHRRFVGPLPGGRLAIMVPYHLGQAVLLVGLAAGV